MERIGIFPLSIVLFPGSSLPLHIFEPRYKQLINKAVENNFPFGINLVTSLRLYPVGCVAEIQEVTNRDIDGKLDIIVTGGQRYWLKEIHKNITSYYQGDIEYIRDQPEHLDTKLLERCVELYNTLIEIVYRQEAETYCFPEKVPTQPSFFLCQKAGLDLHKKQELLEMRSENDRLQLLYGHLNMVVPELQRQDNIRQIALNDGYIIPK